MSLDLEALRNSDGQKMTELDVPELGGKLRIRMISGLDMFRLGERQTKHPNDIESHARIIFAACVVDDNDEPIFNSQTVGVLLNKPGAIVARLIKEMSDFCGLSEDDEDTAKNSETAPA